MNILCVFEDNIGSANMNITLKIARELSKTNKVYGCYCFSENIHDTSNEGIFQKSINLGNYNDKLYSELDQYGWRAKSVNQKVSFLLTHPVIMYKYVNHRVIHGKSLQSYKEILSGFIRENSIDYVLGFTNPYSIAELVASLEFKGKKAIYQMDPFSSDPFLSDVKNKKRIPVEKAVLSNIDKLFTTDLIIRDLQEYYPAEYLDSKTVAIEFPLINIKEPEIIQIEKPLINKEEGKIYFLHAGTLIEKIRNPKVLVDIFEKLPENYILVLAGRGSNLIHKYDKKIQNRIIDLGMVSQENARQLRQEADFLICFNNKVNNMVPSKLFECIDSGKPFLNICQIDDCPTKKYIEGYDMALGISSGMENVSEVNNFIRNRLGKQKKHSEIEIKFVCHTLPYVVNAIIYSF